MVGEKFNRWTIIEYCGSMAVGKSIKNFVRCQCECGNIRKIQLSAVKSGTSKSCGCYTKEMASKSNTTHGLSNTSEYKIWRGMLRRCYNKNRKDYPLYGGRGIKVSDEWVGDFLLFLNDMGFRPSNKHSLDRIDNNKNYCKENCRWSTQSEQMTLCYSSVLIEINGVTKSLPVWLDQFKLKRSTYKTRISKQGMTPAQALTTPLKR